MMVVVASINPYQNHSISIANHHHKRFTNYPNNNNTMEEHNNDTSYKPFAEPNYTDEVEDGIVDTLLSPGTDAQYENNLLMQLKQKLDSVPFDAKSSLVYARQVTDFVDDDHLLDFLYAEHFNVDHALLRLLRYWKNRHKVFGDDYTLPLTLSGAMKGSDESIKQGFIKLLPVLDNQGRAILYGNPALASADDEVDSQVIKVWWYLMHVALANPSVQKNGFVQIINMNDLKLRHFKPKRLLAIAKSGDQYFPMRRKAIHICHPKAIFKVIAPSIKATLSIKSRQILVVHSGTSDRVLETLEKNSIPSTCLPTDIGGQLPVCLEAFVNARRTIEEGWDDNNIVSDSASSTYGNFSDIDMIQENTTHDDVNGNLNQQVLDLASVTKRGVSMNPVTVSISPVPTLMLNNSNLHSTRTLQIGAPQKQEDRKKKFKMHPGRHGDKRMNMAVKARQEDPSISLMTALLAGGFTFPQLYNPGVKLSQVKDTEGVTVYQRKNQLNRRLREERNKKEKQKKK